MQDILEFEKKYKGTDEEREDLLKLYVKYKGDMDAITVSALCCSQEDEPRLCGIIQEAIKNGEVEAFPAFTKENDKKKRARRKRVRNVLTLKPENPHSLYFISLSKKASYNVTTSSVSNMIAIDLPG